MDRDTWTKLAFWTIEEAAALSFGISAFRWRDFESSEERRECPSYDAYRRRLNLIERAVKAGQLPDPITPASFIAWADQLNLKIDDELRARVVALDLRRGQERVDRDQVPKRERDSVLKLIIGMAIAGYGYDHKAKRSEIVQEIASDLAREGVALDPDTIRKYLREGAELIEK